MGKDHPGLGMVDTEFRSLPGADIAFAGIVMAYRLRRMEQKEHIKLMGCSRESPGLPYVRNVEVLSLGKNLPYAHKTGFPAPEDLAVTSPRHGRNHREAPETAWEPAYRVDDIVIAQCTQPQILEGKTENP